MAHGHHDKKEAKLSKRIFLNINIVIFSTHKNQTFLNNPKFIWMIRNRKYVEKQNIMLGKKTHLKLQISTTLHLRNSMIWSPKYILSPKINFLWRMMLASLQFLLQYVLYSWHTFTNYTIWTFCQFLRPFGTKLFRFNVGRIFMLDINVIQNDGTKFIFED